MLYRFVVFVAVVYTISIYQYENKILLFNVEKILLDFCNADFKKIE